MNKNPDLGGQLITDPPDLIRDPSTNPQHFPALASIFFFLICILLSRNA